MLVIFQFLQSDLKKREFLPKTMHHQLITLHGPLSYNYTKFSVDGKIAKKCYFCYFASYSVRHECPPMQQIFVNCICTAEFDVVGVGQ